MNEIAKELCKYCGRDITSLEINEMCACEGSTKEYKKQHYLNNKSSYITEEEEKQKIIKGFNLTKKRVTESRPQKS